MTSTLLFFLALVLALYALKSFWAEKDRIQAQRDYPRLKELIEKWHQHPQELARHTQEAGIPLSSLYTVSYLLAKGGYISEQNGCVTVTKELPSVLEE